MATLISHSPVDTEALGEKFGRAARRGWVIALSGELGAGRVEFCGAGASSFWARPDCTEKQASNGNNGKDSLNFILLELQDDAG